MIRREWEGDFVLFRQPEHARVSGVLAESWGAGDFVRPEPWDDVLLATVEHDIGWREWEERPALNAEGVPAHFIELPLDEIFDIFRRGVTRLHDQGDSYAAALVGRHGVNVFSGILGGWVRPVSPGEEETLNPLDAGQEKWLAEVSRELDERAGLGEADSPEIVEQNGRFVTALDTLSLVLCNGWTHRDRLERVPVGPAAEGELAGLALNLVDPFELRITPWPFSRDSLEVSVRGCRISRDPFGEEADFHAALKEAPPIEMTFRLTPG